jgi:hypothetical protein
MKIGLRLGYCLRDIVKGTVKTSSIFVLIVNSKFNPNNDDHWDAIWEYYMDNKIWDTGHSEDVYKFALRRLYKAGKIHQPRIYGGRVHKFTESWVEMIPALIKMAPQQVTSFPELSTIPDILL